MGGLPVFGFESSISVARNASANVAVLSEKLSGHINSCTVAAEKLSEELKEMRADSQAWREGLGRRLDSQDRMLKTAVMGGLTMLVGFLVTSIGYLLAHFVIK